MDTHMYNLVKDAIKDGKSIDTIIAEVNALAQTAQKELQPQAPLLEKYCRRAQSYSITADDEGRVGRESLITAIATYFVQHGFNPDPCFDNEADFHAHIAGILDRGLSSSKVAADFAQMEKEGASDDEMLSVVLSEIGSMFTNALRGLVD